MQNPLFPTNQPAGQQQLSNQSHASSQGADSGVRTHSLPPGASDPAVEMIRRKIRDLYMEEPDAGQQIAKTPARPVTKHQQYMAGLQQSGMSLTDIQAAWHNYYAGLPDHEKYEVWQEFYVQQNDPATAVQPMTATAGHAHTVQLPTVAEPEQPHRNVEAYPRSPRGGRSSAASLSLASRKLKHAASTDSVKDIKQRILRSVRSGGGHPARHAAKQHLQSLMFGLATGCIVVFVFLFGFFNELVLAPFIQPSRQATQTPVIVDPANTVVGGEPKILIPKINVEIPVDYSQTTTDPKAIELALDKGIVHYPTTQRPGEAGNAAFFGHSSNNIFNPGKYKFAFVLLHKLETGDVFYLSSGDKTFAYRVFSKRIVQPKEVGVLSPIPGKTSTATLITCDPPGTSINRLVVVGEQISPDPGGNTQPASAPVLTASSQADLPGNGPTLWSRLWSTVF